MRNSFYLITILVVIAIMDFPRPLRAEEVLSSGGQPVLSLDETSFDAGEVGEGEEVSHAFIVRNKGDAELIISQVKVG